MFVSFDPRDIACKDPFGAVPCASGVRFTFRPEHPGVVRCTLLAHHEFADRWSETELSPCEGEYAFSGQFTAPDEGELVWYHFRLTWADGGTSWYGRSGDQPWDRIVPWQLTVYEENAVPAWFGRGVTYQIFPDRFFRAGGRGVDGLIGVRRLHESWDEPVDFGPDENGEYCTDFFGGDLAGIEQKLDYLAALGVTTIYLNPIFESVSNHRYDTADYERIDPLLGDEESFRSLCRAAKARGMHVLLDGVFNHTGAKSRYFNADGYYPEPGAAQGEASPYYSWYHFHRFPYDYDAWWGIKTLPAVEELTPSYRDYIIRADDSIVRRWLRAGADGWRLDVADELPDAFIADIRAAMEEESPDAFLLGEVWEDGSNKVSYSRRRRYLLGRELHGLMNYPFRTALLAYLRGGAAADFRETMESLRENYPRAAYYSLMNFLSTHDTPRILTLLGSDGQPERKEERAVYRLPPEARERGLALLRLAALVLFTFPGSPCVYYGDEAGMEGFEDPFNRAPYPWGREDAALRAHFTALSAIRASRTSLQDGEIVYPDAPEPLLVYARTLGGETTLTVVNASQSEVALALPWSGASARNALSGERFRVEDGVLRLSVPPLGGLLLTE